MFTCFLIGFMLLFFLVIAAVKQTFVLFFHATQRACYEISIKCFYQEHNNVMLSMCIKLATLQSPTELHIKKLPLVYFSCCFLTAIIIFRQAMKDFRIMFPTLERDTIECVLRSNAGHVDSTIDQLLQLTQDMSHYDRWYAHLNLFKLNC